MLLNPHDQPREDVLIRKSRELLAQKRPQEAVEAIQHHLSYAPPAATDYELLGIALAMVGDLAKAVSALEQAAAMASGNPEIAYNLGLVYRKAGRAQEAMGAFGRAVALKPDYEAAKRALDQLQKEAAQMTGSFPAPPPAWEPAPAPPAATPVVLPAQGGAGARARCPHCGMESRPGGACEWCAKPLVVAPVDPGEPGAEAIVGV